MVIELKPLHPRTMSDPILQINNYYQKMIKLWEILIIILWKNDQTPLSAHHLRHMIRLWAFIFKTIANAKDHPVLTDHAKEV